MARKQLLIVGPTVRGDFFIRDDTYRVWDGSDWRGFGEPQLFATFQFAFNEYMRLRRLPSRRAA